MGIIYKNGIAYGNQPSIDATLTHQGEAADAKAVGDEISDVRNTLNHKADVIYDTASGDIASFPDGADGLPVKDLTVGIEPVQSGSGDPSPTNVRPISGRTGCNVTKVGKNLANIANRTGVTSQTNIANLNLKAGTYTISAFVKPNNSVAAGIWVNGTVAVTSNQSGERLSITVSTGVIRIDIAGSAAGYNVDVTDIMVEAGPSATTYEPYSGATYPISWQSEAGTVYGGTLDVTSGVLTVTDANIASYNGETLPGEWISDRDVYSAGATPTTGAQVVYKLATPQTYQLTPTEVTTLLGQNNIWADTGGSTVEYPCDTKLYIQKINTPTDDDMIADANIASGKYFIVNNNLYLSTAAILAGDPIKPGTNCTLTNLAAALNALNS